MQYLPNTTTLCLEFQEFVPGIMSEPNYKQSKSRGTIKVHGRGGNGNRILIEFESLPHKYKALVKAHYGDPYQYIARQPLLRLVRADIAARNFYAHYMLPDGRALPSPYQQRYTRQAEWLNMILTVLGDKKALRQELHITLGQFWESVITLHQADKPINPELPTSERRLTERVRKYKAEGYTALVEAYQFTNNNARKVTADIEGLLLSFFLQRHGRATLLQVANDFAAFMAGTLTPVDIITGEAFNREDFLVKGQYKPLALATVRYYLNKKEAREVIDSYKLSSHDHTQKWAPHNRRKGPQYSFSMVSMDDYLPPFKTPDGKRTVWMYVIFDVASTAIIGVSYGTKKGVELVNEALRDMLRLCERNGWGLPMEIEVERSLNWARKGSDEAPDLFTEGNVFPFVRFAKANNSQEKIAERFLQSFKYEELADDAGFLGRPHGRNENYKLNRDNEETRYYAEALIRKLQSYVAAYNAAPHPKHPAYTRYQYLEQHINPDAIRNQPAVIMPYIGIHTRTSIFRGDIQVQEEFYAAPATVNVSATGGRAYVDAYWIPGTEGQAPEQIYIYQDGRYVGRCPQVGRYQNARAERTDADYELLGKQSGRQRAFENKIEEGGNNLRLIGSVTPEDAGVLRVGVSYNKEAWEEEDEALLVPVVKGVNEADEAEKPRQLTPINPQKMQKKASKEGGYLHNSPTSDEDYFSPAAIAARARRAL